MLFLSFLCVSVYGATPQQHSNINRIIEVADYIISHKPSELKTDSLVSILPLLSIDDVIAVVDSGMTDGQITKTVDAVHMVNNLKKGYTLEESRDGVSFTTLFPFRIPNALDIDKLKDIFNSDSEILHKTYLSKFQFLFRNCGALPGLLGLREVIENNVADCREKAVTLAVFDEYAQLKAGSVAPHAVFVDSYGTVHDFSEYSGCTVVIDVWATWCHNCLKKMPAMMEIRDDYADKGNVIFLTVSIDRRDKHDLWDRLSEKYSLHGVNNLIIDSDCQSEFEARYKIFGIPRYIVIGPDGRLVDAFAPGPGDELKKIIDSTLL